MKEKLENAMGTAGAVIWYIVAVIVTVAPLLVLDLPIWADFLIILAVLALPVVGGIVALAVWIWALVVAVRGPQGLETYIFYAALAVNAFFVIPSLLPKR